MLVWDPRLALHHIMCWHVPVGFAPLDSLGLYLRRACGLLDIDEHGPIRTGNNDAYLLLLFRNRIPELFESVGLARLF